MFTVKVVNGNTGEPVDYQRVAVDFGLLRGITKEQRTDKNGESHFDTKNGNGKIYLNGSTAYEGEIEGRIVVYT